VLHNHKESIASGKSAEKGGEIEWYLFVGGGEEGGGFVRGEGDIERGG